MNQDVFAAEDESTTAVLSVGDLTDRIKDLLEGGFPSIWVSGEISNFSRPQSGHCYFTLKDERAQIRAVMWRSAAAPLKFDLHDGLELICQGDLEVYAPRGSYQLVVRQAEPKGVGARAALRKLREKLAAEGLFEPERKRPLPRFPRRIAFVTSPSGAAIRDFLEVLRRRWRGADVLVVPVRVQGEGSALEIAEAIATVNHMNSDIDVLVVGRGGGSLEDLWSFNEEVVVRAIHRSRIPVVSAVGHEIDVTLSDLVADVRALTPSEAAELCVPAADEILGALLNFRRRALAALAGRVERLGSRLHQLADRRAFRRPFDRTHELARRVDELGARAHRAAWRRWSGDERKLAAAAAQLESLSPLGVLGRGYSITQRTDDGALVRDATSLQVGETITTRLAAGRAISRVEQIQSQSELEGT